VSDTHTHNGALRFPLTHEALVSVFGHSRVDRSDRQAAEELGFSGPTLHFLCSTGLPSTPKAEIGAPGKVCKLRALDEMPQDGWECPEEAANWIILGNMPATTVTLDSASGAVYGFYEGFDDPVEMHSDVSSLAYTIYAVKRALPDVAVAGTYEERAAVIDAVQQYITERDPLPFAHEGGEWNAAFDEIAMGMWT
jgi:hypothetical protein